MYRIQATHPTTGAIVIIRVNTASAALSVEDDLTDQNYLNIDVDHI